MQVDPSKPTLKAPGTKHLKLKCDELLSSFALKIKLRRYIKEINELRREIKSVRLAQRAAGLEAAQSVGPYGICFFFWHRFPYAEFPVFSLLCSDYAQVCPNAN